MLQPYRFQKVIHADIDSLVRIAAHDGKKLFMKQHGKGSRMKRCRDHIFCITQKLQPFLRQSLAGETADQVFLKQQMNRLLSWKPTVREIFGINPGGIKSKIPLPLFMNDRYNNKNWNLSFLGIRLPVLWGLRYEQP